MLAKSYIYFHHHMSKTRHVEMKEPSELDIIGPWLLDQLVFLLY